MQSCSGVCLENNDTYSTQIGSAYGLVITAFDIQSERTRRCTKWDEVKRCFEVMLNQRTDPPSNTVKQFIYLAVRIVRVEEARPLLNKLKDEKEKQNQLIFQLNVNVSCTRLKYPGVGLRHIEDPSSNTTTVPLLRSLNPQHSTTLSLEPTKPSPSV